MAIQITTFSAGNILIQTGRGIPDHLAPKGSQYTDIETSNLYFNKDGLNNWQLNVDITNTGSTIGVYTFSSFSSSTVGQSAVSATTYTDKLTFSGINLSILVDSSNKILTLSAETPSNYTFTGGTVNGTTNFTNGLNANVFSAATYLNLPIDVRVTGGTLTNGTATFTNNTGGTFTVSGFKTDDVFVTGGTYSNGTATFTNNTGGTFTVTGFKTDDITVTGGTYSNTTGIATFTNNTGGTFTVSGFKIDDIFVTGGTYSNGTATFRNNTGGTFTVSGFKTDDITITGGTYSSSTGITTFTNNTGGTFTISGYFKPTDDIYTTGMTFNSSNYNLTITRNDGTSYSQSLAILASDMTITGGTYNSGTGIATFTNNTGGTFTVSGFLTGMTDTYTTGFTYSNNTLTLKRNASQPDLSVLINTMTGLTVTGGVSATTISATTFYGNGSNLTGLVTQDTTVTGGTYSSGNILFTNNTGGTFTVSGLSTGYTLTSSAINTALGYTPLSAYTDTFVTGGTYANGSATFTNNTGGTFTITGFKANDIFVTGGTYSTGSILFTNNTGGTFTVTGLSTGYTLTSGGVITALGYTPLSAYTDTFITGGTYNAGTAIFTNNTGGTFTVTGFNTNEAMSFTGGTVTGATNFTNGLTANTFSATTYLNLPITQDTTVTGGTYSNGSILFTNNTGGTFNVTGLSTGYTLTSNGITTALGYTPLSAYTDTFVTGGTYSNGTAVFTNNTGGTFNVTGFKTDDIYATGITFNPSNYNLTITRNDGNSFTENLAILASDMTITGGTYNPNSGVATFTNNTGGTFTVSGFLTGQTDTYVTGLTFSNNVLTLKQTNNQADVSTLINNLSGLTVNGSLSATTFYGNGSNLTGLVTQDTVVTGGTYNSGNILFTNNTGGTFNVSGLYTGYTAPIDVYTTGATYSNNTFTFTNNTGGTFNTLFNTLTGVTVNGNVLISGSSLPNGFALSVTGDTKFTGDVYVTGDLTYNGNLLVTGGTVIQSGLTANTIYTDYIDFNTTYAGTALPAGRIQWDDGNGTLVLGLKGGLTNMELGLDTLALCYNDEATTLTAGTVVYVSGSQGNRPAIKRALATGDGYSVTTLGVVSETIASGAQGFVTTFGMVNNLNTVGLSGGTPIWLSPTVSGGYTTVKPQAPNHTVLLGYVVRVHASVGSVFVHVSNGWEIDELHDVKINNKVQGDLLALSAYNGSDVWVNTKTLNGSYTITGDTTIGGVMKATTVSATTYQNLPTDVRVTGGTYSNGTATFTNNTGGTFTVSGFKTDDLVVTGATYSDNVFNFTNNTGGTFNVLFNTVTGLTANGDVTITGNTNISGSSTTIGDVRGFSLVSTQSVGDEGGEIRLSTAQTNTSLSGGSITFDVYQNKLRFFESGGSNRGVYIDLTAAGAGVSTNLLSGGGGEINTASNLGSGTGLFAQKSAADLQFKSLTSTGGTVTISNNSTTVNLEVVPASNFTGGTVNGATNFTNGLTANTFSATTYFNLPTSTDTTVTGGTYTNGTATFTNNTGGTFTVSGFKTDDLITTGGTYSNGTITFTNNTGGTFNVTGLYTGYTDNDNYLTGATYSNNVITFTTNTGQTSIITIDTMTGLTVNGTLTATNLVGDGSGITNIPTPYGLIHAISSGNYLI